MNFSRVKRIIDLFFNLFFLDATVNYCDVNCSKKVHGVVMIYRLISRQPPFCVSTMLLIFLFTIRTLFSNLRFPISALYSLCKEAFIQNSGIYCIVAYPLNGSSFICKNFRLNCNLEKADNKCSLPKSCQILSPPDYKFGNRICH